MSVPEGKRTESQLAFQTKAIELANYTTTICNNNNIFPKRDRWLIANRIVSHAITILESTFEANDIYVASYDDYIERRKIQQLAKTTTSKLLALMELAYNKYNIEGRRIAYWTRLVEDERNLIHKWMKSDKDRFKNLK